MSGTNSNNNTNKNEKHSEAPCIKTQTYYPEKEGTLMVAIEKTTWKKRWVELKEGNLNFYHSKGGKLLRGIPISCCSVAGIVQKDNNSFIILSSIPSIKLGCINDNSNTLLKEWASSLTKANWLYMQRIKRTKKAPKAVFLFKANPHNSGGFGSGSNSVTNSRTNINNEERPTKQLFMVEKRNCEMCGTVSPTWPTQSGLNLCLSCYEVNRTSESNNSNISTRKYSATTSPGGIRKIVATRREKKAQARAKVEETFNLMAKKEIEEKNRVEQLQKRRLKILNEPIKQSNIVIEPHNRNRIMSTLRNSISIRLSNNLIIPSPCDNKKTVNYERKNVDYDNNNEDDDVYNNIVDNYNNYNDDETEFDFENENFNDNFNGEEENEENEKLFEFTASNSDGDDEEEESNAYEHNFFQSYDPRFSSLTESVPQLNYNANYNAEDDHLTSHYGDINISRVVSTYEHNVGAVLGINQTSTKPKGKYGIDEDDDSSDSSEVSLRSSLVNWNERFQKIIRSVATHSSTLRVHESTEANLSLLSLAQDFLYSVSTYSKIIISELYLDDNIKTIKVASRSHGVPRYIVHNILFYFSLPSDNRYTFEDAESISLAGHEMKGIELFLNLKSHSIHYPLTVLVDYRGFRIIATSVLPITEKTLVYGLKDSKTLVKKNESSDFENAINQMCNSLNICPFVFSEQKNPPSLKCHVGSDGRKYFTDFFNIIPQEYSLDVIPNMTKRLRPELISQSGNLLSVSPDSPEQIDHIIEMTQLLYNQIIPNFARDLPNLLSQHENVTSFRIIEETHRRGINIRHLGRVFKSIDTKGKNLEKKRDCQAILLVEMFARVIKNDLRSQLRTRMKKEKMPLDEPYRKLIIEYINLVFGDSITSDEYWDRDLVAKLEQKFETSKIEIQLAYASPTNSINNSNNNLNLESSVDSHYFPDEKTEKESRSRKATIYSTLARKKNKKPFRQTEENQNKFQSTKKYDEVKKLFLSLSKKIDAKWLLFLRVQSMIGLKFSNKIIQELTFSHTQILSQEHPFTRTDLEEILERVQIMNIIPQVEGFLLMSKGYQTRTKDSYSAMCYYTLASKKFEEVLNTTPNDKVTLRNCAQALLALEEERSHLKNIKIDFNSLVVNRANRYFLYSIDMDRQDPVTLYHYALFLEQCEKYDLAEDHYLRVLEIDPNFIEALHSYGSLLQFRGDFETSDLFFTRILKMNLNMN